MQPPPDQRVTSGIPPRMEKFGKQALPTCGEKMLWGTPLNVKLCMRGIYSMQQSPFEDTAASISEHHSSAYLWCLKVQYAR
jgi:hypothetical protein